MRTLAIASLFLLALAGCDDSEPVGTPGTSSDIGKDESGLDVGGQDAGPDTEVDIGTDTTDVCGDPTCDQKNRICLGNQCGDCLPGHSAFDGGQCCPAGAIAGAGGCLSCPTDNQGAVCGDAGDCVVNTTEDAAVCECDSGQSGAACDTQDFCSGAPCLNGGTCVSGAAGYTCECPVGTSGADCEDACPYQPRDIVGCANSDTSFDCAKLWDGDTATSTNLDCESASSPFCTGDQVANVVLGFELSETRVVSQLRYLSDWWSKRPEGVKVWTSDSAATTPGNGATLALMGNGNQHPWQCVPGEACGPDVPVECCPNGMDQPQAFTDGALIPKWDSFVFPAVEVKMVWLEIANTYAGTSLLMRELQVRGRQCGGTECALNPCFAGVACEDIGNGPVCGACPEGYEGDGTTCTDIDGCASGPCFAGVACTDVAAPGTGFECGECPDGYSGDGITCTLPSCSSASDCTEAGTACFEGFCTAGTCADNCANKYDFSGDTWSCISSGVCVVRNCSHSDACPASEECVSVSNPVFGAATQYECVADTSSPCSGACGASQVCSGDAEVCF